MAVMIISDLIRECGGPTKLAAELGLHQASVSSWNRNGLPSKHVPYMHQITGIPYDQLFELTKPPKGRAA